MMDFPAPGFVLGMLAKSAAAWATVCEKIHLTEKFAGPNEPGLRWRTASRAAGSCSNQPGRADDGGDTKNRRDGEYFQSGFGRAELHGDVNAAQSFVRESCPA
jgi:hypothetical protein